MSVQPAQSDGGESRYRVVLVDDVDALRALVRITLESSGLFEVVAESGDGAGAIETARGHQPDLVLLDVSMPVLDGMEALPKVKAAAPGARVVMLTGFEEARLGGIAFANGADGYLEKGVTPEELVARLVRILDGERAR